MNYWQIHSEMIVYTPFHIFASTDQSPFMTDLWTINLYREVLLEQTNETSRGTR